MGNPDDRRSDAVKEPDGGVIQRDKGQRARSLRPNGTHAQPGVGRHEVPGTIRVSEYHAYHHADRWNAVDTPLRGDEDIDWLASDEWLAYDVYIQAAGRYELTLDVAAADSFGGGDLGIVVDDDPLRRVEFDATGGWYSWDEITTEIELPRGTHTIRLVVFEGGWKLKQLALR
ncbi:carbohydrate-binding protein [Haloarcula salinisoli]|uniref:Carbohydrate-binding protein n=1 Tax=Haloarcula salinisoli TaxID=2487746 RepID=A0A8J7YNW1_9EURY|nr:carbohydrate-binding protein [Halomicroarcula salinisoli]MBX0287669.1 carbohydrate-binding protein [Halomicroarcula salinisoli]MBX0304598.1 carbohydrate-binding protein [Halomicroarcula salinisoli]